MDYTAIFERVEMKYVLTQDQYEALMAAVKDHLVPDEYPHSEIKSIYFDSDTYTLARRSSDHPVYKEKLRLRTYCQQISDSSPVFLELKKKYHGVTYKRRQEMTYQQARNYILYGTLPFDSQIMKEIDYSRRQNALKPKAAVFYSRDSYAAKDHDMRLTFDRNIGFNISNLNMRDTAPDQSLTHGEIIMEVKTITSMPLWMAEAVSRLHIYPANFSKYGKIYQEHISKGEKKCLNHYLHQYSPLHLKPQLSSAAH